MNVVVYYKIDYIYKILSFKMELVINDNVFNETKLLMSQFMDLLKLKKCMHNWFNTDYQLLKETKLEINDKYMREVIKCQYDKFKNELWGEFDKTLPLLQIKYPNTDLKKQFVTLKNEFIQWLIINHKINIEDMYSQPVQLFITKINLFTVHDKKLVVHELTAVINLIKHNYIYMLREHYPISDQDIKNIENIIQEYENYIK